MDTLSEQSMYVCVTFQTRVGALQSTTSNNIGLGEAFLGWRLAVSLAVCSTSHVVVSTQQLSSMSGTAQSELWSSTEEFGELIF